MLAFKWPASGGQLSGAARRSCVQKALFLIFYARPPPALTPHNHCMGRSNKTNAAMMAHREDLDRVSLKTVLCLAQESARWRGLGATKVRKGGKGDVQGFKERIPVP